MYQIFITLLQKVCMISIALRKGLLSDRYMVVGPWLSFCTDYNRCWIYILKTTWLLIFIWSLTLSWQKLVQQPSWSISMIGLFFWKAIDSGIVSESEMNWSSLRWPRIDIAIVLIYSVLFHLIWPLRWIRLFLFSQGNSTGWSGSRPFVPEHILRLLRTS
jgi:hypothetical protein